MREKEMWGFDFHLWLANSPRLPVCRLVPALGPRDGGKLGESGCASAREQFSPKICNVKAHRDNQFVACLLGYHLHCIVTGGGLGVEASGWIGTTNHRLFQIPALSAEFCAKFRDGPPHSLRLQPG